MNGAVVWLNKRVLAPGYYWKTVCDPIKKQSIFFFAKNNVGNVDDVKVEGLLQYKANQERWCNRVRQYLKRRGQIWQIARFS